MALANEILNKQLWCLTKTWSKASALKRSSAIRSRLASLADEVERIGPTVYQYRDGTLTPGQKRSLVELSAVVVQATTNLKRWCKPSFFPFGFGKPDDKFQKRLTLDATRLRELLDNLDIVTVRSHK